MTESLHAVLEGLPQTSLTTHILDALDTFVPGEWRNITVFEEMVKDVTSETDEAIIQQVGERAMQLYADESNGYQRAVMVYKGIDSASTVAGVAALASMAGQRFEILSFLNDVTPKPDTTQAIDAGIKFAGELVKQFSVGCPYAAFDRRTLAHPSLGSARARALSNKNLFTGRFWRRIPAVNNFLELISSAPPLL